MPIDVVKQTNRTILFDVVNPKVADLFSLMTGTDEEANSLSDAQIEEKIKAELLTDSFDDFLRKFKPTIYSYFDGSYGMVYTLEKPPASIPPSLVSEIVIDKNDKFLKMFSSMMDKKSASGDINVKFDYAKVVRELSSETVLNNIKRVAKELAQIEKDMAKLDSGSPLKRQAIEKHVAKLKNTERYYNEMPALVELMLGIISEDLKNTAKLSKSGGNLEPKPGIIVLDAGGELKSVQFDKAGYEILKEKKAVALLEASINKAESDAAEKRGLLAAAVEAEEKASGELAALVSGREEAESVIAVKQAELQELQVQETPDGAAVSLVRKELSEANAKKIASEKAIEQKNNMVYAKKAALKSAYRELEEIEGRQAQLDGNKKRKEHALAEKEHVALLVKSSADTDAALLEAAASKAAGAKQALEDSENKQLIQADGAGVAGYRGGVSVPIVADELKGELNGDGEFIVDGKPVGKLVTMLVPNQNNVLEYQEQPVIKLNKDGYRELAVATIESQFENSMEKVFNDGGLEYDPSKMAAAKELVLSAFTDKAADLYQNCTVDQKIDMYNRYAVMCAEWQRRFILVAKPLIEKLLGVKTFFEQYRTENPLMKPALLVVNSHIEEIVDPDNLRLLQKFLKTTNNKADFSDTIWFGIAPSIKFSEEESVSLDEATYERYGFFGDLEKGTKILPAEISTLKELLSFLAGDSPYNDEDFKIQVFFSFEANEDTSFNAFSTGRVNRFIEKSEELAGAEYSKYAIPCMPNFTVVPPEKANAEIGRRVFKDTSGALKFSAENEEAIKYWMGGVYIDAAFAAAGLVAAYQCPNFLNKFFKGNARREFPGVRFDIESGSNSVDVTTTLGKEIRGYTSDLLATVNERGFGFIFSSDNVYKKEGGTVKNITVFKARSLGENASANGYEKIFKRTAGTYIERVIWFMSQGGKREQVDDIFKPGRQVSKWQSSSNNVNSILRQGDTIVQGDVSDTVYPIQVTFSGETETMMIKIDS